MTIWPCKTIRKILLPTDCSALSLAVHYGAEIYLLIVADGSEKKARKELNNLVTGKLSHVGRLSQVVRVGEPSREIVRFARVEGIDIILIATHREDGDIASIDGQRG